MASVNSSVDVATANISDDSRDETVDEPENIEDLMDGDATQEQRTERQAITGAIASFECPDGFKRSKVPTATATRSKVYENGILVEKLEPEKGRGGRARILLLLGEQGMPRGAHENQNSQQ